MFKVYFRGGGEAREVSEREEIGCEWKVTRKVKEE